MPPDDLGHYDITSNRESHRRFQETLREVGQMLDRMMTNLESRRGAAAIAAHFVPFSITDGEMMPESVKSALVERGEAACRRLFREWPTHRGEPMRLVCVQHDRCFAWYFRPADEDGFVVEDPSA